MNKTFLISFSLLMACQSDKTEEDSPPQLGDHESGDTATCGGEAPVIQSVTCINGGIQDHPDEGPTPTLIFNTHVIDEDEDLNVYRQTLQFDDVLDSSLSPDAEILESQGVTDDDECGAGDVDLGLTLYLLGGPPEFGKTYEFYVMVTDAANISSDAFRVECTVPNADGTDGDAGQ